MLGLAVVFIVVGLALVLVGAFVPRAAPAVQVGWALFAVGALLLVVAALLGGLGDVDLGDGDRADAKSFR